MIKYMELLSLYHQVEHENRKAILDMVEKNHHTKLLDCGCGRYYPFPNMVGRFLSWIDKKHAVYLTVKVRK